MEPSYEELVRLAASEGRVQPPRSPCEYAFTEIMTFKISANSIIETAESNDGKLWADTVRTYCEDPGTKLLWWGRLLEDPDHVKLVVDWIDADQYREFQQSPKLKQLRETWGKSFEKSSSYVFPSWANDRRNAFTKRMSGQCISTILTFRFPFPMDPSKIPELRTIWEDFSYAVLWSKGGGVSSKTCCGLATDNLSFCGVVRWVDIASVKQFLASEPQGLKKLKEFGGGGMDVEFAEMYGLEDGWLGKVTKTERPVVFHKDSVLNGYFG